MLALAAAFLIVRIVEVGQAQHVAELVADGSDAVERHRLWHRRPAVELHRAGIVPEDDAIACHVVPAALGQHRAVGPEQAGVVAAVAGGIAGEDEVDHVDHTVAVAVVVAEVDVLIGFVDSCPQQAGRAVQAVGVILALVNLIRSEDVELRLKQTVALVAEVVAHAARAADGAPIGATIARVVLLVHHVEGKVVIVVARESLVVELNKNDQTLEVIVVILRFATLLASPGLTLLLGLLLLAGCLRHGWGEPLLHSAEELHLGSPTLVGIVGHLLRGHELAVGRLLRIDIEAPVVLHHRVAVVGRVEMQVLVADQANGDIRAVGLHHPHGFRQGRNGLHRDDDSHQRCQSQKKTFHSDAYYCLRLQSYKKECEKPCDYGFFQKNGSPAFAKLPHFICTDSVLTRQQ